MPAKKDKGQLTVDTMIGEATAQRAWEHGSGDDDDDYDEEAAHRDAAGIHGTYQLITRGPAPSAPPTSLRQSIIPQHLAQMTLAGQAPPEFVSKPHGEGVMYAKRKNNPSTYMVHARKNRWLHFNKIPTTAI